MRRSIAALAALAMLGTAAPAIAEGQRARPGTPSSPPGLLRNDAVDKTPASSVWTGDANRTLHGCAQNSNPNC